MKRLTTNKSVSEMSMTELAHNSCYRGGDGWARYRDYGLDIDARELTRMLLKDHADGDDLFTDDEDFEGWMMDCLQDGLDSMEGLIALFYRNLWAMADLRERLKYYEDLDEQEKLLKLPCAMGDTVYRVRKCEAQSCERCGGYTWVGNCYTDYIGRIFVERFGYRHLDSFGKSIFLTREEAEAALESMEDRNEG